VAEPNTWTLFKKQQKNGWYYLKLILHLSRSLSIEVSLAMLVGTPLFRGVRINCIEVNLAILVGIPLFREGLGIKCKGGGIA
jgi:hypothetical protein